MHIIQFLCENIIHTQRVALTTKVVDGWQVLESLAQHYKEGLHSLWNPEIETRELLLCTQNSRRQVIPITEGSFRASSTRVSLTENCLRLRYDMP